MKEIRSLIGFALFGLLLLVLWQIAASFQAAAAPCPIGSTFQMVMCSRETAPVARAGGAWLGASLLLLVLFVAGFALLFLRYGGEAARQFRLTFKRKSRKSGRSPQHYMPTVQYDQLPQMPNMSRAPRAPELPAWTTDEENPDHSFLG